jgi:hypothetical protein
LQSQTSSAGNGQIELGIKLLADLQMVFGNAGTMSTQTILKALHELTESPWNDLKGKPLNDRGLALRLRNYGVKSKQIRVGDVTLKGYDRTDLYDVWKRYLPLPPDKSKTSETSETSQQSLGWGASDVSDPPPNVSDALSEDPAGKRPDKTEPVSNVSVVSPLGEDRGDDYPDLPDCLRRPAPSSILSSSGNGKSASSGSQPLPLCDFCGRPATTGQSWPWPGRVDIRLHSSCEGPWWDTKGRPL